MIPHGVTVRRPGESITRKPNLLDKAAACDDRDAALKIIADALGLDLRSNVAKVCIWSDAHRWSRVTPDARLAELASWLNAECYECMDLVLIDAPLSVVGTND